MFLFNHIYSFQFILGFSVIIFTTLILYCYNNFINMSCRICSYKVDYVNINAKNIIQIINKLKNQYQDNNRLVDVSKLENYLQVSNLLNNDEILEDLGHRCQELNYYSLSIRLYYKLLINKIKKNEQDRYSIQLVMNKLMILYSEIGDAKSARFMFEQAMSINRDKNAEIKLY